MMDHVLPIPNPDWDNPQPYDGPTPEEVDAFSELRATADGIRSWVTNAYLHRPSPDGWAALSERLAAAAETCAQHGRDTARTVPGEIEP